jgi:hypothetical protein
MQVILIQDVGRETSKEMCQIFQNWKTPWKLGGSEKEAFSSKSPPQKYSELP